MNINNYTSKLKSFSQPPIKVNQLLNSMESAYKFKTFKKNIKFKRFNRGLTRFIINRKKYILRKKRTTLIFKTYHAGYWTSFYKVTKQAYRFYQMQNILGLMMSLTNVRYMNRVGTQGLEQQKETNLNTTSISKKLVRKSVFFNKQVLSFLMVSKQGTYGVNFLSNNYTLQQNHFRFWNSGLLILGQTFYYPTSLLTKNSKADDQVLEELVLFARGSFFNGYIFSYLKAIRHILVYLTCLRYPKLS